MHLRTPWDKPTTTLVEEGDVTMTTPNHPEIPVHEVSICSIETGNVEFKLSFINVSRDELLEVNNSDSVINRALRRRGLYNKYVAFLDTIKLVPSYSTPRRLIHGIRKTI